MKYSEWDGCGPRQKIRRGQTIANKMRAND